MKKGEKGISRQAGRLLCHCWGFWGAWRRHLKCAAPGNRWDGQTRAASSPFSRVPGLLLLHREMGHSGARVPKTVEAAEHTLCAAIKTQARFCTHNNKARSTVQGGRQLFSPCFSKTSSIKQCLHLQLLCGIKKYMDQIPLKHTPFCHII